MVTTMSVSLWLASVSLALTNGINNVIKPCGQKLCKERCESLSYCSSPVYDFNTLTCVLRNKSDSKTNESDLYRRITARDGRNIQVPVGLKKSEEKLKKNRTRGNFVTDDPSNALIVKEKYKIKGGDCFSYNLKGNLIIPGICDDQPPKYFYRRGKRMNFGTFRPAKVKGIWVNTNKARCPISTPKEITARVAHIQNQHLELPQYARTPRKEFIIWAYTGKKTDKFILVSQDCRDSIKEVKHHSYEY